MKGIVLAGGSGSRLHPITLGVSKQLLPIYDKPMIYYPLSVMMLSNIKDILIITTPSDLTYFKKLLKDGKQWGLNLEYKIQDNPGGIAEAFIIGEKFIDSDSVCLILGDNIFIGPNFSEKLNKVSSLEKGARVFAYKVSDPERFGVIDLDKQGRPLSIEEKPKAPKSNYIVTGLYFYDNQVVDMAKSLKRSERGELEITDLNQIYLNEKTLTVELLDNKYKWIDTGTYDSLLEASQYIKKIQEEGEVIACLEDIAYSNNWISNKALKDQAKLFKNNNYGLYLRRILRKITNES